MYAQKSSAETERHMISNDAAFFYNEKPEQVAVRGSRQDCQSLLT